MLPDDKRDSRLKAKGIYLKLIEKLTISSKSCTLNTE